MASSASSSSDLLEAVKGDDLVRVKEILESGVDPNNDRGQGVWWNPVIPLHAAALRGQVGLEVVNCLLQFKADVRIEDSCGQTALHYAAFGERAEITELLVSHDADVNKQDTVWGWTALHLACANSYVPCVRILLQHGADVALKDSYGMTARDKAVDKKKSDVLEVVQLLDDFIHNATSRPDAPPPPVSDMVTDELRDLKENLRELDSVNAKVATLNAVMRRLLASKAEVDQLSTSRSEVGQLITLKIATVRDQVNDLSSVVEELFPKKKRPQTNLSIDAQLRSISQSQGVEVNWWNIGKELGFSRREMIDFLAKYDANDDTLQPAIHKMLQTWCDNSNLNTDDEKLSEIWRVLRKFGVREEQ